MLAVRVFRKSMAARPSSYKAGFARTARISSVAAVFGLENTVSGIQQVAGDVRSAGETFAVPVEQQYGSVSRDLPALDAIRGARARRASGPLRLPYRRARLPPGR